MFQYTEDGDGIATARGDRISVLKAAAGGHNNQPLLQAKTARKQESEKGYRIRRKSQEGTLPSVGCQQCTGPVVTGPRQCARAREPCLESNDHNRALTLILKRDELLRTAQTGVITAWEARSRALRVAHAGDDAQGSRANKSLRSVLYF